MKKTYNVVDWRVETGKGAIGVPWRNKWIYAKLDGDGIKDCTIQKVTVHFPAMRCTFNPPAEFRMKYGGVTVTHQMGSSGGVTVERSYSMNGAKDTMFKTGDGEVVFYAYHPYDEGYMSIDDANVTVEVEYTPKASRLDVTQMTVEAGKPLTFTVAPYDNSCTHKATLTMGDKTAYVDLAAGVTSGSIEVPLDWLTIIPDKAMYEDGALRLDTYKGGAKLGSKTVKNITMTAPMYHPVVAYTEEHMLTVDGQTYPGMGLRLVQGKCGYRVTVTKTEGYYGSTTTATIRLGDKTVTGQAPLVLESGLITTPVLNLHVTGIDSRGRTALSRPFVLILDPYAPPSIELEAWRVNDAGEQDDYGVKGAYRFSCEHTDFNGDNPVKLTLSAAGVSEENPPDSGTLLPSEFVHLNQEKAYDVTLTAEDAFEKVSRTVRVPSALFLLHGRGDGRGAGIGHAATQENALVINPAWDVFAGGAPVSGAKTLLNNANWTSGDRTVPDISKWRVLQVVTNAGSILAFQGSTSIQGGGFNVGEDTHRTLAFRANRDGDKLTLVTAHYMNHEPSGTHSTKQTITVQSIIGLIRDM